MRIFRVGGPGFGIALPQRASFILAMETGKDKRVL
jgi:hypothetical protein